MENVLINEKQEEEARDRLSSLPRELIVNILKFLSISDVFRMHCLSKQWTNMNWWLHIPNIKFIDKYKEFTLDEYKLVRNCLYRRCHQHAKITRFKLHLLYAYTGNIGLVDIYYWLSCFSKTNTLKELDLSIQYNTYNTYNIFPAIPESVLLNVRSSLTLLKLQGISLKPSNTSCIISLPSLTTLSLINPSFENATIFQNLISGCPSIKSLDLRGEEFIVKEKEYDPYSRAWKLKWEDVRALEPSSCVCVSLTSLLLWNLRISDKWLENLILGLPLLERLTLDSCSGLRKSNMRTQTLKSFYCYNVDNCISATLDTPNLVKFNYNGCVDSIFSINSTNLLEVNLSLYGGHTETGWYLNMIMFLSGFNCSSSTSMKLYIPPNKDLLVPQNVKKICRSPLPHLKHLKVRKTMPHYFGPSTNDDFWTPSESSRAALLWWAPSAVTLEIEL